MSFTSYVAQAECAPHLQFPLFHPAPSGLEQHLPFPPKPFMTNAPPSAPPLFPPRAPPSFTYSPSVDFSSDEELGLLEPAMKKQKVTKPYEPKRVQFHTFKTVYTLTYTALPGSKPWRLVPIRQRADEDGIFYPSYWAKLRHHKKIKARCLRRYVEQGCTCKKDNKGKDTVCLYCCHVHSRVMLKNHQRDEDDIGMKVDITLCSALCRALDLRGMPPAAPLHARKGFQRFFS